MRRQPAPGESGQRASASDLIAAELGLGNTRPTLIEDEKLYLAGFLTGIGDTPAGVPVLPAGAPVRNEVRLWIDGLLAGRYIRSADGAANRQPPSPPMARSWCGHPKLATLKSLLVGGRTDRGRSTGQHGRRVTAGTRRCARRPGGHQHLRRRRSSRQRRRFLGSPERQ